jgi:hypothetical protein
MNTKHRSFKCPLCNKNGNKIQVNNFMLAALNKMNEVNLNEKKDVSFMTCDKQIGSPSSSLDSSITIGFEYLKTRATMNDLYKTYIEKQSETTNGIYKVKSNCFDG